MTTAIVHRSTFPTLLLMFVLTVCFSADLLAQGATPADSVRWFDVEKGLAMAKSTGKPIFLWFYGDWCGYCKKMRMKVFPDSAVIATINNYFVPIRVETQSTRKITFNGVSMTESDFAVKKFNARSVPSTWFVEPNGCRVLHLRGYRPISDLVKNLEFVRTKGYGECQNVSLVDPPPAPKAAPDSTKK